MYFCPVYLWPAQVAFVVPTASVSSLTGTAIPFNRAAANRGCVGGWVDGKRGGCWTLLQNQRLDILTCF